ncbi:reverse transcriptase domain-containing protein [Peribacillus sp. FSL H8-0477]|uniref:reverse transcriptase domain-containing protein n=1 Tax=Peribacillus sp. FSL H8-0477 TaxID=2921388 RepID=UPI0030F9A5C0
MNIELLCLNEVIIEKFKSLKNFEDVANLFEIPAKELRKILVISKKNNYSTFTIKKKNGKDRTIHAPKKNLSILQKKFSYILSLVYNNHLNAHGFIKNRSIVSNASVHLKQKNILNFDLENYFENINFGRVRAMFIHYYSFNETVASTLANICCHHDGFLPQGAATSPAISNILSFKLDKELTKLARKNHCIYTRYADDITFSTKKQQFPTNIAFIENASAQLAPEVIKLVKGNGFLINENKTRLNNYREHLSVTGITVNEKLNVERKYIRRIRSILHCIEKNIDDVEAAKLMFNKNYKFRQKKEQGNPDMFDVLRGMISFVGQVKGKEDPVYLKLANRYNQSIQSMDLPLINIPITKRKFQERNTYVIESLGYRYLLDGEANEKYYVLTDQGTGFILKGIGLITNYHVLKDYIEMLELEGIHYVSPYIQIQKSKYAQEKQYAKLLHYDKNKDIAILSINGLNIDEVGFEYNESFEYGEEIQLIGYPDFKENMDISIKKGVLLGERFTNKSGDKREVRYEISPDILGGNSGGPVVNMENEVLAIAAKGAIVVPNEVIPVKEVIELANLLNGLKS